jgi:hypothetical protein
MGKHLGDDFCMAWAVFLKASGNQYVLQDAANVKKNLQRKQTSKKN